ncbi:MAG TPA: ABC-F family ATP-binding cassette domain-containing protein [Candidatus Binatia bacterium]|nr:ABC-F family ATP-binding cassette domain-containing protein [Candidatus Binatia bacterium]
MSLIVLENCDLAFGGRAILSALNLRIGEEDRVGLVGRNGSGKTCLLRILARQQEPDTGTVRTANAMRTGYLPQEVDIAGGRSLIDSVLASVPGRMQLEQALEVVEQELAEAQTESEQMELAEKLATLHDDIVHFDSNYSPHEAHAILDGLGFRSGDASRDLSEFSGGWKMRAVMASLLFQKPDLLMLDEPTNHLDVTTIGWLAEFLKRYRSALVLVCHDRDFLNEQINRVVSYEAEGVRQYAGNYEDYRRQRAEEAEVLERRASNLARQREQAERFIRRFRAQATKARAVQSRIRALDKLEDVTTLVDERSLRFRFPPCQRSGIDVVTIKNLGHDYGPHHVFDDVSGTVRRGDKVAIIGPNGAGKTTLLKIIAGELAPSRGELKLGHNVKPGYYAQHVTEKLDVRNTIFDEVWQHSAYDDITQVRNVLGTFLFSDDDVDKNIRVLSGGEKARVALARLMVDPGNLLLMDEPTNHLDLESSEALAEALTTYDGTVAFVSHNRSFVRRLATRIWHVHDGGIEEFPGSLDEFLYHLAQARRGGDGARSRASGDAIDAQAAAVHGDGKPRAAAARPSAAPASGPRPGNDRAAKPVAQARPASSNRQREQKNKTRELERRITDYETRIGALEKAQEERSRELSDPAVYADQSRYGSLLAAYTEDKKKLEELMLRWEQAQASLAGMTGEADA